MYRVCLLAVVLVMLAACRVVTPVPQSITPTAPNLVQSSPPPAVTPTQAPANVPTADANPPTSVPVTPTTTPIPTPTLTPIPTNTTLPTETPLPVSAGDPVITIARPVAQEFVSAAIPIAGTIANVAGGSVLLSVRSLDGQPIGPAPVPAATNATSEGLQFSGEIALELPPTPRQVAVIVSYGPQEGAQPVVEAGQAINLLGRYGRVDRIIVEAPKPLQRPADAEISVQGVAPGPPARIVVRLIDESDQVIETTDAEFRWYQPGLPCAWSARLPNNPAGTQLQVITLGPDDTVLDNVRVRLAPR